jgi:hypothetical protein
LDAEGIGGVGFCGPVALSGVEFAICDGTAANGLDEAGLPGLLGSADGVMRVGSGMFIDVSYLIRWRRLVTLRKARPIFAIGSGANL